MHLAGRTITHVVSGLRPEDAGPETSAEHPVFRRHPVSGRTALYLSTPERCVAMSDMDRGAARQTIGYLYEHSTAEDNTFRHAWSPGDVVMWDNGCVLHRADHSDVTGDRVMHRGMVAA
jgi:taurine dioxygenase